MVVEREKPLTHPVNCLEVGKKSGNKQTKKTLPKMQKNTGKRGSHRKMVQKFATNKKYWWKNKSKLALLLGICSTAAHCYVHSNTI